MSEIRERLLKVLRLAEQGVGGEKENAEVLLEKLLKKYNIDRRTLELDQQQHDIVWHPYTDQIERELLGCIARAVCQRKVAFYKPRGSKRKVVGIEATPSEHAGIMLLQDVYVAKWREAQEELLVAFAWKHQLSDNSDRHDEDEPEPVDKAKMARMAALVHGLEHVDRPVRRITAGDHA